MLVLVVPVGMFIAPPSVEAAVQITSISPFCATIGDTVVITGNGFGAHNITIKVGGVEAQVISATGNKAKFIVPAGVVAGMTTVTATNPGGQTGSIACASKAPRSVATRSTTTATASLTIPPCAPRSTTRRQPTPSRSIGQPTH